MKMRTRPVLRFIPALQRRLRFRIAPYYIVREGGAIKNPPPKALESESMEMKNLDSRDMPQMAAIPGRSISEEVLATRLKEGKKCYGIRYQGQLAAFTWVDLKEFGMSGKRVLLKENEAYLFDAYTLPAFRGKGLAPIIRYYAYERLEEMGKTTLYSITDFFNPPAMQFKEKLGARKTELRLLLWVFKRPVFDICIKKYD
jgi:GNAT superfamily N-acetyltransferase